MRFNYKDYPQDPPHPVSGDRIIWHPVLPIQLSYPAKHSPPSKRFEVWVDSGSPDCYFNGSIGRGIGIDIVTGIKTSLGGIVSGPSRQVFFHEVALHVAGEIIKIKAGFTDELSVAGVLGRRGFFDHFIVTFDQSSSPPVFEIKKIHKTRLRVF